MIVTTGDARYAGAGVDAQLTAEEFLPLPRLREDIYEQFPDDQGNFSDLSYDDRLTRWSEAAAALLKQKLSGPVQDETATVRWFLRDRNYPLRVSQRWLTGAADLIYTAPGDSSPTTISGALTVVPVSPWLWDICPEGGVWPEIEEGTRISFTVSAGLRDADPASKVVRQAGILAVRDLKDEVRDSNEAIHNLLRPFLPQAGIPATTEGNFCNPNEGFGSLGFQGYRDAL